MIELKGISKIFKKAEAKKGKVYGMAPKISLKALDQVSFTCHPGRHLYLDRA